MPLSGTNGVVPGSRKPLADQGRGGNLVDRITRSQAEGDPPVGKHDAGFAMDRRKCDQISGVEDTDGGINICDRL